MAIGTAVLLCGILLVAIGLSNPFGGQPKDSLSVAITTPFVGQGVEAGTAVVLHGVEVGKVKKVTNTVGGVVQLETELQSGPTRELTNTMDIDFRPVNYFGVPGINVVPHAGGEALRDGSAVNLVPKGNFTLSELLNQLGDVSVSSLTPQLVSVIDRATRYTDGLNPFIETAVTVTRAVQSVQTVDTERLLTNLSTSVSAFPAFTSSAIQAGTRIIRYDYYPGQTRNPAAGSGPKLEFPYLTDAQVPDLASFSEEQFRRDFTGSMDVVEKGLFASVGKLVGSHVDDLFPLIAGIKAVTDTGPVMLRPQDIAQNLAELRARIEKLYYGNGEQRAVSVRVLLDSLPGVAAPIGITTEATS
ncbi:mammalian cell entry protein [Mycolicibacterium mucogenicum]|uniref:Mammalian cell entry protein n=1 Tax=Mycolicibacterium mucogenicum TaxID=56689 RepID=A0A1A3H2I6_MYCMU|nr:mammalian cell entry protein [Mycolicibacterium mucogenicum]OBJ42502.1 mammalian cell entry protein [Mycolicibacterium mucogenicum]